MAQIQPQKQNYLPCFTVMCFGSPACFPLIPLFKSGCSTPVLPSTTILQLSSQGSCPSNQFSILSSPTPAWRFWHHTGAGSRTQSLGVGGIYHSSAGISFQEKVSPLAGLPTGGEKSFLTVSNDMNTFHYTRFHCCSQLSRYSFGFVWAYWCASFEDKNHSNFSSINIRTSE